RTSPRSPPARSPTTASAWSSPHNPASGGRKPPRGTCPRGLTPPARQSQSDGSAMHDFNLLYSVLTIAAVMGVILGTSGFLIHVERKVAAYVQDRVGPNRVGPYGLFQSVADGLKFLLKEEIIPYRVDKFLYILAPAISLGTALLAFAVVPFG